MEPLLGVYAGYSLGGQVVKPGPDLDPYVQEGAGGDRVRHRRNRHEVGRRARARRASGSVQTALRGGRQRRQFRPGPDLRRPVAQFFKAIKAKYPDLQVIATMPVKGMTPDVVDDHYYKREQGMFELATPLRQHRPQGPEDLRRRMGHARRHADSQLRRRPGRRRVPDRPGAEQRPRRDVGIRAAVRQRQSRAGCSGAPT